MKEMRYFIYKQKYYIVYNYLRKKKIAAILEGFSEDKNS